MWNDTEASLLEQGWQPKSKYPLCDDKIEVEEWADSENRLWGRAREKPDSFLPNGFSIIEDENGQQIEWQQIEGNPVDWIQKLLAPITRGGNELVPRCRACRGGKKREIDGEIKDCPKCNGAGREF